MKRVLALALCLAPGLAGAQESDKDFLTRFLEENLSGAGRVVTITGFQGALSSQASLTEMTIADSTGVWFTAKDVTLDWSRSALLSGQVVVNSFSAGEIDLARMPVTEAAAPSAEAKGFSLPNLPVSVDIQSITAPHIVLGSSVLGQAVEGALTASMQLSGGEGAAKLELLRTDQGPSGAFSVSANYVAEGQVLTLDLAAREGAGGVAVGLLGVPGAPSAEVTVNGSGPLADFAADVALRTDGVTRLGGKVVLTQADGASGFEAHLAGDPTPVFLPQYAAFFGPDVAIDAKGQRFADGRMELSQLHVAAEALALDGLLNLDAKGVPVSFALTGKIGVPGGSVLLPSSGDIRLDSADLTLNYSRIAGQIWQGKVAIAGLDQPALRAESMVLSGSGHIRAGDKTAFDGKIDFMAGGLQPVDAGLAQALGTDVTGNASVTWETGGDLAVSDLSVAGAGFEVATSGAIGGLATGFALTGSATGFYDDLTRVAALAGRDLAGRMEFDLKGTGSPLTGMADLDGTLRGKGLRVGMAQMDGLLAGDSVIAASVKRDETGTTLRSLRLDAGGLGAQVSGKITSAAVDLAGDVSFADLGVMGAGYGGSLHGKASISGPLATAQVTLDADAVNLSIGQKSVDGLLAGASHVTLRGQLDTDSLVLSQGDLVLAKGTARVTGRVGAVENDIKGRISLSDLTPLALGLRGAAEGTFALTGAPDKGTVTLEARATGLALGQVAADTMLRGTSTLAATLDLTPDGVGVKSLVLANPQMRLSATGVVTGTERRLQLESRLNDLGQIYPQFPGALVAKGTATQDAGGYTMDLTAKGPGQIDARVKGTLSNDMLRADLAISGRATAGLANVIVAPRTVSGAMKFDLRLKGALALSSLRGTVQVSGGRVADPAQTFSLTDVNATATLAGGQAQIKVTSAVSTGGTVAVAGSVGLSKPMNANLTITARKMGLRDPDLYKTKVTADLTFKGPVLGAAVVAGTASLARTELQVPSTGFTIDGSLAELKHVNEPAASLQTRQRAGLLDGGGSAQSGSGGYGLNIKISAPNQVFIRGRGLDAELGGSLTLRGTTQNIIPAGAFNLIRGRLDILGKRLDLTEALLQLQGALVPYLRIMATTQSDGFAVSVLIEGEATDPKVSFTSSPSLPEEEVLARLLFDRGLDNLTALQAIQLGGAVATLAGKGGQGIIGNLRTKAGLDNLDVTQDDTGATSVTLGKYLSKKVYTEVQVGQGSSTGVSVNLDLTPNITLKGQVDSTGNSGVGLFLQRDY